MAQNFRWIGDIKSSHSKAIPREKWEENQSIIVEKYASMTLIELRNWMAKNRGFSATYVY